MTRAVAASSPSSHARSAARVRVGPARAAGLQLANLLAVQRVIPADKPTIEGIVMFSKRRVVRCVVLIALAVVTSALPVQPALARQGVHHRGNVKTGSGGNAVTAKRVQPALEGRDVRYVRALDNPASGGF
jgi:hypothetical protein